MKGRKKLYAKPSIEILDVQWSDCIAASPGTNELIIRVKPGSRTEDWRWFDDNGGSWDTTIL